MLVVRGGSLQVAVSNAGALQPGTKLGQDPVDAVVDRLGVGEAEYLRDLSCRKTLDDVELGCQTILRRQTVEGGPEALVALGGFDRVVGIIGRWIKRRRSQLAQELPPPSLNNGPVGRTQLRQERAEAEPGMLLTEQLEGLAVTSAVEEHELEDPTLAGGQLLRELREPVPAVAVTKPVHGGVADDRDQPGG